MRQSLGAKIRELREKKDVSLRAAAKAIGVSPPFLSDVEFGRRYPKVETLEKIADYLEIDIANLQELDHRGSVSEIKKMVETDPNWGFAFRTVVDEANKDGLKPEDLIKRIHGKG